ncbi:MAG: hypothetical protein E7395_03990 [Ruminococcaceae bacterium]|nr:hypothetical protein [Oscillospiraceae bacterium]
MEQQRKRLNNFSYANRVIKNYFKRHRIGEYIPGQVTYNLGEYPQKFSVRPTEYDYELIKSLSEKGVGLIQLHEDWNDSIGRNGADKWSCPDKEGMKEFIKLCHSFNIKVIPYISTGYVDVRQPYFREDFLTRKRKKGTFNATYFRYVGADANSPSWLAFFMDKFKRIFDEYEFDGMYNDMGYGYEGMKWNETPIYDPYLEDLLVRVYNYVKSFNGIVKIHNGFCWSPNTEDKVYDYLWVGETLSEPEALEKSRNFEPYVIACPDFRFVKNGQDNKFFASTIPYLQFLLRVDGRPVTGERACVDGVEYVEHPLCRDQQHCLAVKKYMQNHPDGPYVYSLWSDIPDDVASRERWFDYLKLYKPMVEKNTVAYLGITESDITTQKLPAGINMSLFVGDELYICISNTGAGSEVVEFNEQWTNRETGEVLTSLTLKPYDLLFLKK